MDINIYSTKKPQVLLLGNGLLQAFGDTVSWSDLVKQMHINSNVDKDLLFANIPFPLEIVIRTNDNVDTQIKDITISDNNTFANKSVTPELYKRLEKLIDCGFDHILTTNYGYEIEAVAIGKNSINDYSLTKGKDHTDIVKRAENKFYLHTYYTFNNTNIWHIHGEGKNPNSIILGHYYYGNLLTKYKKYLDSVGYKYEYRQQHKQPQIINSWIDAFILGDIYILGLSMDFSELDLWWLINRKKREKANTGNIYFFEPNDCNTFNTKIELLKCYNVTVENCNISLIRNDDNTEKPELNVKEKNNELYRLFYDAAIDNIINRQKNYL